MMKCQTIDVDLTLYQNNKKFYVPNEVVDYSKKYFEIEERSIK